MGGREEGREDDTYGVATMSPALLKADLLV